MIFCIQFVYSREFLFLLSNPRVVLTNPKCVVKTDIVCNRQPAEVKFSLIEKAQGKFQSDFIIFVRLE